MSESECEFGPVCSVHGYHSIPVFDKVHEPNKESEEGPCPRCGGDHSWCQSVADDEYYSQPGSFFDTRY